MSSSTHRTERSQRETARSSARCSLRHRLRRHDRRAATAATHARAQRTAAAPAARATCSPTAPPSERTVLTQLWLIPIRPSTTYARGASSTTAATRAVSTIRAIELTQPARASPGRTLGVTAVRR
ncbi:hypothetical protein [Microtetraspora malaysiensis]|uniref:hypothetical protein n=1 Tax=Microtetraspora malaysiensis TaxID=161358 RepID=UPI003D8E610B